jgi:phage terminase Nu1 subunit (DNA packaging protein)
MAKQANGRAWQLLGQTERSPAEEAELVEAACASLYHWRLAGSPVNRQRGLWLVAHVHTVLGDPVQAVKHARACMDITREHEDSMEDFDVAYAHEGLARALALAGEVDDARRHLAIAQEAGGAISDPEDKGIFMTDFETGEWYGIR